MKTFVPRIVKQKKAHLESLREQTRAAALRLKETEHEIYRLKADVAGEQKKHRDVLDDLARKSVALERIRDFVDGRITHYVVNSTGYVSIVTGHALPYMEGRSEQGTKLLCLFGKSDGDWSWRINDYKDGSGSWSGVYPCTSMEEAQQKANAAIRSAVSMSADRFRHSIQSGVVLDGENMATFLKLNAESRQTALKWAREALAKADAVYQQVKEEADAADVAWRQAKAETP